DAFLRDPETRLFVVADGMGGYEGGALASQLVVSSISECFEPTPGRREPTLHEMQHELRRSILHANRAVSARRYGAHSQMGATVAALWVSHGHVAIAHVGDSRVYRYRNQVLEQLTRDHSLYAMLQAAGIGE